MIWASPEREFHNILGFSQHFTTFYTFPQHSSRWGVARWKVVMKPFRLRHGSFGNSKNSRRGVQRRATQKNIFRTEYKVNLEGIRRSHFTKSDPPTPLLWRGSSFIFDLKFYFQERHAFERICASFASYQTSPGAIERARSLLSAALFLVSCSVVKTIGMLWNVVKTRKCCEIPSRGSLRSSELGGFCQFEISQHSADAQKKLCTNFSEKVHTFCCSRAEVDVFGGSGEKRPSDFSHGPKMLWNVVKCCEIDFHNISQHFAFFHNIRRNFTTFHNIYGKVGDLSFPTHPGTPPKSQ